MQVVFLGSGSSGNATLLVDEETHILVDCGFSAKELKDRLRGAGVDPLQISAVLISHEHSDHVSALSLFKKRRDLPIFLSKGTAQGVQLGPRSLCSPQIIKSWTPFSVGQLEICPFPISHDAREPMGFVFSEKEKWRMGMATDLGVCTTDVIEALTGCDVIALESNHDLQLLMNGPYPWHLKQRIRSPRGHLSNEGAMELLTKVASPRLKAIFAMHVSQTNNRHYRVEQLLKQGLSRLGFDTFLTVVGQNKSVYFP